MRIRLRKLKVILKTLLKNPKSITDVVNWNLYWRSYVEKKYPQYKDGLPVIDPTSIEEVCDVLEPRTYNEGSSLENALLRALVGRYNDARFLEIGTLYGDTMASVAEVAKECITIDIRPPNYMIGKLIKDLKNVEMVTADTYTLDWTVLGYFDLIFIDGGKSYELLRNDVLKGLRQLNQGGVMVIHDYVLYSDYYDDIDAAVYKFDGDKERYMGVRWEVLAGVLDAISGNTRPKNIYYIANTRSMILTDEEYPEWDGLDGIYTVTINYTGERV